MNGRKKAGGEIPPPSATPAPGNLTEDVYRALIALGLAPVEARPKLDVLIQSGTPFQSVEEAITLIFSRGKG